MSGYRPSDEYIEMKLREARAREQPERLIESTRAICIGDTPLQQRCRELADALERAEREKNAAEWAMTKHAEWNRAAEARAQKAEAVVEAARLVVSELDTWEPTERTRAKLINALTAYDEPPTDGECQRCGGKGCEACDARFLPVDEPPPEPWTEQQLDSIRRLRP